jgi:hypothetical protein
MHYRIRLQKYILNEFYIINYSTFDTLQIVIVGQSENKTVAEYLMNIQPRYLPMKTIALIDPNKKGRCYHHV